jgi:hypothetical protein
VVRFWFLALLLGGCDRVFGLEPHDATVTDAPVDGPPIVVTGHLGRDYIFNETSGIPTRTSIPYASTELQPEVRLAGGTVVPVDWKPDGTFSFVVPAGQRYRLLTGTSSITELQTDALTIDRVDTIYGHPDGVVTGGSRLQATVGPITAGHSVIVTSSGVWNLLGVPSIDITGHFNEAWSVPLASASKGDRLYLNEYAPSGTRALVLAKSATVSAEMSAGTTNLGTVTLGGVTASKCAAIDAKFVDELGRIRTAIPTYQGQFNATWNLFAAWFPESGPGFAFPIAQKGGVPGDERASFMYPTPFPDASTLAAMHISVAGSVTTHGVNIVVYAGTSHFQQAIDDGVCHTYTFPGNGVAIPTNMRLANVLLADGVNIGIANQPATIDLTWESTGPADSWIVSLADFSVDPSRELRRYYTAVPRVAVDPTVFLANDVYVFRIIAIAGTPNAGSGDLVTLTYPYALASVPTPGFLVAQ